MPTARNVRLAEHSRQEFQQVLCQSQELGLVTYKPEAQAKEERGDSFARASGLYPIVKL
jgi:hypothetical protein